MNNIQSRSAQTPASSSCPSSSQALVSLTTEDLRSPRGWLAREVRGGVRRSARAGVGAVGGASLLAALLLAMPAGALAATPPSVANTFKPTGSEQTFTVPAGVTSVHVQAIGAAGQAATTYDAPYEAGTPGGVGADVTGELSVTPGETLYVEVAGDGLGGAGISGSGGGEGGGASDVRTVSSTLPESLESRLLVAGGGGGGGGAWDLGSGGRGGNAGADGAVGSSGERFIENGSGGPGSAGTLTGGGVGGTLCEAPSSWSGAAGTFGLGGAGGTGVVSEAGGGGGGAGYWGGGGGEGGCGRNPFTAGGGGGGSSYAGEDVTSASFGLASASTEPSITISYATPATATPESSSIAFPGVQPQSTVSAPQTVTLTNTGGTPLQLSAETFGDSSPTLTSDHPEDFLVGSSSCGGEIVFEETCQLTVRFAPQSEGPQTATLQIASNAGAGPTTIALSGAGGQLPQGEPGTKGADGKGLQGPAGPQGERGPAGPAATYECHPRQGHGKFATACFVRVMLGSPSVMKATLRRDGAVYATGPVTGAGAGTEHGKKGLTLRATRAVPAGRYRLVLVSRDGVSSSKYVTVK